MKGVLSPPNRWSWSLHQSWNYQLCTFWCKNHIKGPKHYSLKELIISIPAISFQDLVDALIFCMLMCSYNAQNTCSPNQYFQTYGCDLYFINVFLSVLKDLMYCVRCFSLEFVLLSSSVLHSLCIFFFCPKLPLRCVYTQITYAEMQMLLKLKS